MAPTSTVQEVERLRAEVRCSELKIVKSCSQRALPIHLFTDSFAIQETFTADMADNKRDTEDTTADQSNVLASVWLGMCVCSVRYKVTCRTASTDFINVNIVLQ